MTDPSRNESPDPAPEPRTERDVQYKGAPLDSAKGPGLGCFWTQVVVLAVAIVLTPLSAMWDWPLPISIVLLATMLVLLLFVGQTAIFLMRLVAADRRAEGRRRPMRGATPTVGQIEDETRTDDETRGDDEATMAAEERHADPDGTGGSGVRE
ncbi:MAG TPA: hypothetical protein VF484_08310 [Candidatus Limnocylindrales bacterium]